MTDPQENVESTAKVALITGSGRRRLGNVVARALAADGYNIALHYHRSREDAQSTRDELRQAGLRCEAYQANVASEDEVDRMFDAVAGDFGRLDVLVAAAAIWETISLERTTADDLRRSFDVNTLGTFLCARRAGLQMAQQSEGGAIITIGDWAIARPYLDHSAYFMSKGAIPALTRALAVELAHRNPKVRVNCIHPGPVMFPPGTSDGEREQMRESTLVKDAGHPETIATAVKFLIDNPFVTGTCLPVDGGRTIFAQEASGEGRTT
jgi:pteridine reductase